MRDNFECFAYNEQNGKCTAMSERNCECSFYKTKKQFERDKAKADIHNKNLNIITRLRIVKNYSESNPEIKKLLEKPVKSGY